MTLPAWLERAGFVAVCLVVPIVWGCLVNWLFARWSHRRMSRREEAVLSDAEDEDSEFIDYSI